MSRQKQTGAGQPLRWFVVNSLMLIICLIGLARLDRSIETKGRSSRANKAGAVEQTRPGWWETEQAVYSAIPARVLFRLTGEVTRRRAENVSEMIWSEVARLGQIFNAYNPKSELGRLNGMMRRGGRTQAMALSEDLYRVFYLSKKLFALSRGGFDPSIGPIRELWRKAVQLQRPPSQAEIERTRDRIGFDRFLLPPSSEGKRVAILQREDSDIDFGAIAKGYAVDRVEALLRKQGITSALISLGGEISAFGRSQREPWCMGIQHPRDEKAIWGQIVYNGDLKLSTSGNYRQPLHIAGKSYYHIFDPRSGRPVPVEIESVTTLDTRGRASSALLDGAATAIAVVGTESGIEIVHRLGIDALMLVKTKEGSLREIITEGFEKYYTRNAIEKSLSLRSPDGSKAAIESAAYLPSNLSGSFARQAGSEPSVERQF